MDHNDSSRRSWVSPAVVLAVALMIVFILLLRFGVLNADLGNQLIGIGSLVVSVVTLVVSMAKREEVSSEKEIADAYDKLAGEARRDWKAEFHVRGLDSANAITLTWGEQSNSESPRKPARPMSTIPDLISQTFGQEWYSRGSGMGGARGRRSVSAPKRLLITGEPGAGKTSLAVQIIKEFLSQPDPPKRSEWPKKCPVPVLVSLASWDPGEDDEDTFETWLTERLATQYPSLAGTGKHGNRTINDLVERRLILPVLDGLDEMPEKFRDKAIRNLNLRNYLEREMILTCRAAEYQLLAQRPGRSLDAVIVIELKSMTAAKVDKYFRFSPSRDIHRWTRVIQYIASQPGSPLAEALSTPLMLSLASIVYSGSSAVPARPTCDPDELLDQDRFSDSELIRKHLFEGFLPAVYPAQGTQKYPTYVQARKWLTFLAEHMETRLNGETDFGWWQLERAVPRPVIGGIVGLLAGIGYGTINGLGWRVGVGAGIGLLPGIAVGLLCGLPIRHAIRDRRDPTSGLVGGLIGGLVGALAAGVAGTFDIGRAATIVSAFPAGLGVGIWIGPAVGLYGALVGSALGGFVAGLLVEVGQGGLAGLANGLAVAVAVGVAVGLPDARPPARGITWSRWGLLSALAAAIAVGMITAMVSTGTAAVIAAAAAWVATALVGGITEKTVDRDVPTSPETTLKDDRRTFVVVGLAYGLASLVVAGMVSGLATVASHSADRSVDVLTVLRMGSAIGIMVGVGLGLVFAFTQTAWGKFALARLWLSWRGKLPRSIIEFLADAHERQALRQVGSAYQFRHREFQHHLFENRQE